MISLRHIATHVVMLIVCAVMFVGSPAWAAATVSVRGADHPGFSRLVFEWSEAVDYTATVSGDRVSVMFQADGNLNAIAIRRLKLDRVVAPSVTKDNGKTLLRFVAKPNAGLHHYRSGKQIVIDVKDSAQTAAAKAGNKPVANSSEDAFLRRQLAAVKEGAAADAKARAAAELEQRKVQPKETARLQLETALQTVSAKEGGKVIQGKVEPIPNGVVIRYQFQNMVPAAAYARGDTLLVVWPGQHIIAHPPLETPSADRIRRVNRLTASGATILQFQVRPGLGIGLKRDGTLWTLEVKDQDVLPREGVIISRQNDPVAGVRLFAQVPEPGLPAQLVDPTDNQPLLLIPISAASAGVLEHADYPGGAVVRSIQGLAIKPKNASVQAIRHANGVALIGLEATGKQIATRGYFTREDDTVGRARLVDLAAWAGNSKVPYAERKAELLYALSMAPQASQQEARWNLARFYLANGMAADAVGVLERMVQIEPDLASAPAFRAVRGVARLKMQQFDRALEDLGHPLLDNEPEMLLWRTIALEALQRPADALAAFAAGSDVLGLYDQHQRALFRLAAVRADIAAGNGQVAARELEGLDKPEYSPPIQSEAAYWRGVLASRAGDRLKAIAEFTAAQNLGDRRISAMASLALTEDELAQKTISPEQAIDRLDRLRFAWRGDDFELSLLERLGTLYLEVGEQRNALSTMRQAANYFKPSPRTRAIADQMTAMFRKLFLEGGADSMPPAQALGLYYDFQDLTPMGADGDMIIRKMAERLVNVDLYDRAAELLEHQVKYRLEGIPQAAVAARLAMVYLMNASPDKAIAVLRATRQSVLPADVRMQRNQVEARALLDLDRADEAEVVLEGDNDPQAQLLRADIYWKQKNWPRLVQVLRTILPPPGRELSPDDRRLVMRAAVAETMLSDEAGLARLRTAYGAAMKGDALGAAFDVITSNDGAGAGNLAGLSNSLADIEKIEAFMKTYKAAFKQA